MAKKPSSIHGAVGITPPGLPPKQSAHGKVGITPPFKGNPMSPTHKDKSGLMPKRGK